MREFNFHFQKVEDPQGYEMEIEFPSHYQQKLQLVTKWTEINFTGFSDMLSDFGGTYKSINLIMSIFIVPYLLYMVR